MKKIGYFGFEPMLTDNNDKSSACNANWLIRLFREAQKEEVVFLNGSVGERYDRWDDFYNALKNSDTFVFTWRWPMPGEKYKMRQLAFERQMLALEFAFVNKIPCIIHDSDMMQEDIVDVVKSVNPNAILTRPAFFPAASFKSLMFPSPYDERVYKNLRNRKYEISYIGNNYMRYLQMANAYSELSSRYSINVWGNWMSQAIESDSVETLVNDFPGVVFNNKIEQSKIRDVLSDSKIVHQFAKPEYSACGFLTPRFFEANYSGCVVVFPQEFSLPYDVDSVLKSVDIDAIVNDEVYYKHVWETQCEIADEFDGTPQWIELLKNL